jgi:hypothetical protein
MNRSREEWADRVWLQRGVTVSEKRDERMWTDTPIPWAVFCNSKKQDEWGCDTLHRLRGSTHHI